MRAASAAILALAVALASGCASYNPPRNGAADGIYYRDNAAILPTVGVTDFENRAGFSGSWNLGHDMADVLVHRLMETKRVEVLERQNIGNVVGEITRQAQDLFRREGRAERGRLKNAQYLIRGSITDFTVTGDASGWFGVSSVGTFGVRGQRARVAMVVTLSDVETGEILSSIATEGSVSAGGAGGQVNYKSMSFGGDAFFRTPLGKATDIALDRAIKKILRDIPAKGWQARVAAVENGVVIVNGGRNAGVQPGEVFIVREPSRAVTDPVTGNVIDRIQGRVKGKISIKVVNDASSHAVLVSGAAERGDVLEPGDRK